MNKPIYKNYKSGKYYTVVDKEDNTGTELIPVFVDDNVYDAAEVKIDRNGKVYKILNVEPHTTKNGYNVLRYKRG